MSKRDNFIQPPETHGVEFLSLLDQAYHRNNQFWTEHRVLAVDLHHPTFLNSSAVHFLESFNPGAIHQVVESLSHVKRARPHTKQ